MTNVDNASLMLQERDLEEGFARRLKEAERPLAVACNGHLGTWLKCIRALAPSIGQVEIKVELWRDDKAKDPMGSEIGVVCGLEPEPRNWQAEACVIICEAVRQCLVHGLRTRMLALFDTLPSHGDSMTETHVFVHQDLSDVPVSIVGVAALIDVVKERGLAAGDRVAVWHRASCDLAAIANGQPQGAAAAPAARRIAINL